MSFKKDLEDDLEKVFFNSDEFATEAVLFGDDLQKGVNASVIFDEGYQIFGEEGEMQAVTPNILVRSSLIEDNFVSENSLKNVKLNNKIWGCTKIKPNADGTTLIFLGTRRK